MLEIQQFGTPSDHPTLVIVHGLFGSGRNWRAIARHFGRDRHVVTLDMRNHGNSFWSDDHSYPAMADDLRKVIQSLDSPIDLMGHSMGGKAAMVLALESPELINRLLIIDIAPTGYNHDQASNVEIMKSLPISDLTRRSEADEILAESHLEPAVRAFFLQSLILSEQGNSWKLNLDSLGKNMDLILGFPEISGQFKRPALFLRGALSPYVSKDEYPRIKALFPASSIQSIDGAGHWLHAEATRAFITAVASFID
ncbi:esterase [Amylibacter marinus]|uniref:Esterase n=1 Tax=Amylibacter marinus TaxID=1475483 RepID=A0ABQ5VVR5_9RHOB|nr:alpha/beta fold hydrolase [Amylibacter marinus]GLQ35373.1 esterase [Amylibacter marinus]